MDVYNHIATNKRNVFASNLGSYKNRRITIKQLLVFGLALGTTFVSGFVFADQCVYVSAEQAKQAQELVVEYGTIASFCEPCGMHTPIVAKVDTVENISANYQGFHILSINGKNVDLAYTFVKTGENTFENLSKLVDCTSHGVSQSLALY